MTTLRFWGRLILGLWLSLLWIGRLPVAAAPATAHPLAEGIRLLEKGNLREAVRKLEAVPPLLGDYAGYHLAAARIQLKEYPAALAHLEKIWKSSPPSPLQARAAILGARAYLGNGQAAQAAALLRRHRERLPQPSGGALLAEALEAAGDLPAAAAQFQEIFYGYPESTQAAEAAQALVRLQQALGGNYPPPSTQMALARAAKLDQAGQYRKAQQELEALAAAVGPADRDLARVRLGASYYAGQLSEKAYRYLLELRVTAPEAAAERLYYLLACARRLGRPEEFDALLAELEREHTKSPWRLQALIEAGNYYLLKNHTNSHLPLYRAAYQSFPEDPRAAYCHWKVVWAEYLARGPRAAALLREHLERYPSSEKAAAALYYLARLGRPAEAKAYCQELAARFPNFYYGMLAREWLRQPGLAAVAPDTTVKELVAAVSLPPRSAKLDFTPSPVARQRIARARMLEAAKLEDLAELELAFGGRTEPQPHVLALELARILTRRGAPERALRYVKSLVPDYLYLPVEGAPKEFWDRAFPFPYRATVESYARKRSLDPFLVAGLIRQESEFDPKAISRSRAYGLTQVIPATGRRLSRKAGIRRFSSRLLLQPAPNINLGTYHLRGVIDRYQGRLEAALAAYNAGETRADAWLGWAQYAEPSEFIETVPITETRNYVQIVLRNADVYRRLYARRPAPQETAKPARSGARQPAAASKPARTSAARKAGKSKLR